jgi:hypothetical protein
LDKDKSWQVFLINFSYYHKSLCLEGKTKASNMLISGIKNNHFRTLASLNLLKPKVISTKLKNDSNETLKVFGMPSVSSTKPKTKDKVKVKHKNIKNSFLDALPVILNINLNGLLI